MKGRCAAAHLQRMWFRIPWGACKFVCCECCVLSFSRGILLTAVRRCVWSRTLVNKEALAHSGLCSKGKYLELSVNISVYTCINSDCNYVIIFSISMSPPEVLQHPPKLQTGPREAGVGLGGWSGARTINFHWRSERPNLENAEFWGKILTGKPTQAINPDTN
jgi:hypothetical protein